jgi:hypothetical protein
MRRQGLFCRVEDVGATAERTAPRLRHPLRWYHVVPGLIAISLVAAACGGPAGHSVAELSTSATTHAPASTTGVSPPQDLPAQPSEVQRELLKFAQCIRSHGVPGFPDPNGQGAFPPAQVQALKGSPQLKAAGDACEGDLPSAIRSFTTPQGQAALLRFAQCMRSHGVANFPDPGSKTRPKAGSLDPYSPQFQGAARDCKSFLAPVTGTGSG